MKIALPMSILLALVVSACSTTPTQETAPAPVAKPAPAASSSSTASVAAKPVTPAAAPAAPKGPSLADLKNPANLVFKRSVYFEYNKYEVQLDYFSILEAHSKLLKAVKDTKILIQGNADERGSSEYNLALGQKRAEAVKENLKLLGVKEDQMEAVSLGKEKPKNPGHDEAAWAENRRADILYKGEY